MYASAARISRRRPVAVDRAVLRVLDDRVDGRLRDGRLRDDREHQDEQEGDRDGAQELDPHVFTPPQHFFPAPGIGLYLYHLPA